jgi:hypothetical protein
MGQQVACLADPCPKRYHLPIRRRGILNKPGKLDTREFAAIKQHTMLGFQWSARC